MSQDPVRISVAAEDGSIEFLNVTSDITLAARRLPYAPERYFETSGSQPVPIEKLVQTRARAAGIANAVVLMAAAYEGAQPRRGPIHLRTLDADRFYVIDGNSSATIAAAAGWPDIPCIVLD